MKTVDIATYCEWNSYGSILQAWALKHHLTSLNCNVNHLRLNTVSSKNLRLYYKGKSVKNLLINTDRFLHRKALKRRFDLTSTFMDQNFNFLTYKDYESLKADPPSADAFIAGSDQIWNPNSFTPFFYLDFVKDKSKRISYAASMGVSKIPQSRKDEWYNAINNLGHISVREQEVKEIIAQNSNKEISVHIDPTFLVDKEDWRTVERPFQIKQPYILVYALYWDKSQNARLKKLHQKTGLPVYAISAQLQQVYAQKKFYDVSVQEFVWLFDNASYVVTSSFHGVAFSIIFEKKFSTVINPQKPSRQNAVLDTFEIQNVDIENLADQGGPDYKRVREIIANEREKTDDYLRKTINI